MNDTIDKIKRQFEENPVEVITAVATTVATVVGLGNMMTARRNSRTWKKEVNRRTKMTK